MREINTGVCKWRGQFFFMKSYIHTDIITRVLTRLLEGLHEYYFCARKSKQIKVSGIHLLLFFFK